MFRGQSKNPREAKRGILYCDVFPVLLYWICKTEIMFEMEAKMKRTAVILSVILILLTLSIPVSAEEGTVYLDGTGARAGSYLTLPEAAEAVADGGTIVVCGDTATPSSAATTLPAKTLTITSENGAKLIVGRAMLLNGDTTLRNITVVNAASDGLDFIYTQGHDFTVESDVTTLASETTGRFLSLYTGGAANAFCDVTDQKMTVKGGEWRNIYLGNWSGTFLGVLCTVTVDGATIDRQIQVGNMNSGDNFCEKNVIILKNGVVNRILPYNTAAPIEVTLAGGVVKNLECDATVTAEEKVLIGTASAEVKLADGVKAVGDESVDEIICTVYEKGDATGSGPDVPVETEAPDTKAPDTEAPETKAPDTEAPDTKAPETKAPDTKAPETGTPETKASGIADATGTEPAAGSDGEGGVPVYVWAIIGVALAAAAVCGVIAVIKKKKA